MAAGVDPEPGLRLAGALFRFWDVRGYLGEGFDRLTGLLARPEAEPDTVGRAKALHALGTVALARADQDLARGALEDSARLGHRLGSGRLEIWPVSMLAFQAFYAGDTQRARVMAERAHALATTSGRHRTRRRTDVDAGGGGRNARPEPLGVGGLGPEPPSRGHGTSWRTRWTSARRRSPAWSAARTACRRARCPASSRAIAPSNVAHYASDPAALARGRPGHHRRRTPDREGHGWFVDPTVFGEVSNDATIAREDAFGPVLAVIEYTDVDDAVAIANDSDYGIAGSVFTTDLERGLGVARRVRTGTFGINGYDPDVGSPFGGVKASGVGRELGPEGLAPYVQPKAIYLPA